MPWWIFAIYILVWILAEGVSGSNKAVDDVGYQSISTYRLVARIRFVAALGLCVYAGAMVFQYAPEFDEGAWKVYSGFGVGASVVLLVFGYFAFSKRRIKFAALRCYEKYSFQCPMCEYDLSGNKQANQCPECGWEIPAINELSEETTESVHQDGGPR